MLAIIFIMGTRYECNLGKKATKYDYNELLPMMITMGTKYD